MADSKMAEKRYSPLLHIAVFSAFAATSGVSCGADWRMMIASSLAARLCLVERSLLSQLENVAVPEKKRIAARKVLAA